MKRLSLRVGTCLLILTVCSAAFAKGKKPGPLTGTWECTSHGSSQGDFPFTLMLDQNKDVVTGSVSTSQGDIQINSGTAKKKNFRFMVDTPQGMYTVTGKMKGNLVSGEWTNGTSEKGTWDGHRATNSVGGGAAAM